MIDFIQQYVDVIGALYKSSDDSIRDLIPKNKIKGLRNPRLIIDPSTGKLLEIYLDASLLTRWTYHGEVREICPLKEYHVSMIRDKEIPPTEAMTKGKYFETQVLGSGSQGEKVESLPLIRGNKKSTDNIRIDSQILVFKGVVEKHGMVLITKDQPGARKNTQIKSMAEYVIKEFEKDGIKVFLTIEVDWITPLSYKGVDYGAVVVDLKLTGDVRSTFGEWGWGDPKRMDHTQAFVYSFMLGLPFFYLVFDYKKNPEYEFFPVNTNLKHPLPERAQEAKLRFSEMHETIRKVAVTIYNYHYYGWYTNPSNDNCKDCPIEDCIDRGRNSEI